VLTARAGMRQDETIIQESAACWNPDLPNSTA
jgi:hypothetical protein